MRHIDMKFLINFNARMGMYVCPCNQANLVAFLCGYECGAQGKCRFTEAISSCIENRYRIKAGPLGWNEQVRRLAERRSLDWMEMYLIVSSEVLNAALNSKQESTKG